MEITNLTELEFELIMIMMDERLTDRVITSMKGLYFPQPPPTLAELIDARESAWEKVREQYDDSL